MSNNVTTNLQVLNVNGSFGMEFGMFKLKKGVSESDMLHAAKIAEQKFLCDEDGFLGHAVLKGDGDLYADVTFAITKEKAEEICGKWLNNEFTLKYLENIDPDSVNMSFWDRIK